MSGLFLDFEMFPANYIELATGLELLNDNTDLDVLKIRYTSQSVAAEI
jgi:hypothetical protein